MRPFQASRLELRATSQATSQANGRSDALARLKAQLMESQAQSKGLEELLLERAAAVASELQGPWCINPLSHSGSAVHCGPANLNAISASVGNVLRWMLPS